MNIYCIGRNYTEHAKELGNAVPEQPIIFLKPTHALVETTGQTIELPKNQGEIHHELEVVLKINQPVQPGSKASDVVSEMALGLDLTLRDVQTELKKKGHPWLRAKGFKNSAIITPFWSIQDVDRINEIEFSLTKNGDCVQTGYTADMIFNLQRIIDECGDLFGLEPDDLIFTGTPSGVGPLNTGDECTLYWDHQEKGSFIVG